MMKKILSHCKSLLLKRQGFAKMPVVEFKNLLKRKLNIGSGGWRHKDWLNLDMPSKWYSRYQEGNIDIEFRIGIDERIPLDDKFLNSVFCSHVVEHIPDRSAIRLFSEVHRVMQDGGVFRITCPDMSLIYRRWVARDQSFFNRFAFNQHYKAESITQQFLHCFAALKTNHLAPAGVTALTDTEIQDAFESNDPHVILDSICQSLPTNLQIDFPACHFNWWTQKKLRKILTEAGFSSVQDSAYLQSIDESMRDANYFDRTHPWMSLYVDAIK